MRGVSLILLVSTAIKAQPGDAALDQRRELFLSVK